MEYHRLLNKQINKHLPPELLATGHMQEFLNSINEYFLSYEKDKRISDHAFVISEREYQEAVTNLRLQNNIMQQSIHQLKEAIAALDQDAGEAISDSDHDIIKIIEFLKLQISRSKELEHYLLDAKNLAEKASRAKSDFLSVMSHEIRTPLNAIIGYIHLLIQEDPQPKQIEFLNILQVSARNLLSLINDVLDFSKIEEGKIVFAHSDFDLRKLINDVRLANKIRADENNNQIKVMMDEDIPRFVRGDITRLTQILNNLLSNAIKFTKNGKVTLELQLIQDRKTEVEIQFSIVDTGIGISPENQQSIFERFTQAHSYITREFGGSGLGLAIIKKLLQLMNSDIYVQSELGKGSNFYFSLILPKSQIVHQLEQRVDFGTEDLAGLKILLVEDVEFNSLLAEKMLTNWKAEVTIAENGAKAVEFAMKQQFDLILMDVQMPVMDGLTASIEIRKFDEKVPIFPLTASTSQQMQEHFANIGIRDFIFKPINPDSLHKTILKFFGNQKLQQGSTAAY